jgi:hypothetical protein
MDLLLACRRPFSPDRVETTLGRVSLVPVTNVHIRRKIRNGEKEGERAVVYMYMDV